MDEPCSALDVEGTRAIEELMFGLKSHYTIVIVTHNMAQARRASDECIFMLLGELIEHGRTEDLFLGPDESEDRRIHRGSLRVRRPCRLARVFPEPAVCSSLVRTCAAGLADEELKYASS